MELVKKKEDCCGCRTCEKVCPKQAITMVEDECGFLYPEIDESKCVNCGLCLKRCVFQKGYKKRKKYNPYYAYGARHKKDFIYNRSRSGGVFVALSTWIINNGGVVYGAGYDEEKGYFKVRHKRAETKKERNEFCGSKYVQSDLGDTFSQIKKDLEDGRKVLFSGTGCQVGALYSFLHKKYSELYTIDIICHGVPSPRIWSDYLHMKEEEYQRKVKYVNFRNKEKHGWKEHRELIVVGKKEIDSRVFTNLFYKELISRPSCYQCVYANQNRVGDITIADFWGHEDAIPGKWDDDKGVSLVLVNNPRGMQLWDGAKGKVDWVECTGYPFRHSNLVHPTEKREQYEEFWEDYKAHGFVYCAEKYVGYKMRIRRKPVEVANKGDNPTQKNMEGQEEEAVMPIQENIINKEEKSEISGQENRID